MLKRAIRKALHMAQDWLGEELPREIDFSKDAYAYPMLGFQLRRILASGGYPQYAWGVLNGAYLAQQLGIKRISVIELGVAGGRGLISLEKIAIQVEQVFGVAIDVYGFDTGVGLPRPRDYRDVPNLYTESTYSMDVESLKKRLTKAQLILGLMKNSVSEFLDTKPSPIAFVSIDVDLYSSTMHGFKLFDADHSLLLPRVHCYFDDIMGFTVGEHIGERQAISDFNQAHKMRKISQIFGLKYFVPAAFADKIWTEMFYMAHFFDHELYGRPDGLVKQPELRIEGELNYSFR